MSLAVIVDLLKVSRFRPTALTAGHDGKMLRWEVENLEVIDRFVGHRGEVNSIAIASDGSFAISGGQDKTARIWNLHRQSIVGETANLVRAWQSTSPIADLTINHGVGSKDK
ncbi:MAG: WD40 repeat protein [Pirellulaceae bacterium]|jgi:WD40 repeat protein